MVHLSGSTKTTQGGDSAPFLLYKNYTRGVLLYKNYTMGDGAPFLLYKNYKNYARGRWYTFPALQKLRKVTFLL